MIAGGLARKKVLLARKRRKVKNWEGGNVFSRSCFPTGSCQQFVSCIHSEKVFGKGRQSVEGVLTNLLCLFSVQTTAVGFPFAWDTTWLWLVSFNWYHLSAAKPLCSCVQLKQVQSETKRTLPWHFFFYFLLLWQCLIELPQLQHPYSPAIVDHSQCHIPISANVSVNPTRLSIKGAACRIHVYVLTNCKDFLLVVGNRNASDFKVKVRTSDPAAVQG